ncbi:DUF4198 domain-containing protein [Gracilibacillus lacisalsi]|uniref:DUF4198 domain-containing protein n=1 Tax=Gracilibacillus lacisalsi TaxID=393087 RepID=UPI00037423A2|nr:DUF4198 domain-containing protein [Gracilibacillus lacisalsi]
MKKVLFSFFFLLVCFCFFVPTVSAHELYLDVEEFSDSEELRVDVKWGHIRDYVSEASHEDYELFVRYPNGEEEQLELEAAGVNARAYVPIIEEGDYIFWAERVLGTYTPEDEDTTQLSSHMAKIVHHVGNGSSQVDSPIGLELELVPTIDVADFSTGSLEGYVVLDNEEVAEVHVTAYGPEHEVLEQTTDQDGRFSFDIESSGEWLVKANLILEEDGEIDGEEYDVTSHTSTLLLDTKEEQQTSANIGSLFIMLVIGLLSGSAATLFVVAKRSK